MRLRLSQPSLAGVGAGAELGKTLSSCLMDARHRGVLCQAVSDDQVGVMCDPGLG